MNPTKTRLQILPGSAPGKIRVRGDKGEADYWLPRIRADKVKIRALVDEADELVDLILRVANHYECPPDEISVMFRVAAFDPINALTCYRAIVREIPPTHNMKDIEK
jgi:hypothetical protein